MSSACDTLAVGVLGTVLCLSLFVCCSFGMHFLKRVSLYSGKPRGILSGSKSSVPSSSPSLDSSEPEYMVAHCLWLDYALVYGTWCSEEGSLGFLLRGWVMIRTRGMLG